MTTQSDTRAGTRLALMLLALLVGSLVLALAIDAYIVTGFELRWKEASNYIFYAGVPAFELATIAFVATRSKHRLRDSVILLWILDVLNFVFSLRGGFGFY